MPVDTGQFTKGLGDALERARRAAQKGLTDFGQHVIGDAQEICPKDTGYLKDTGVSKPATVDGDVVTVVMGFNANYATPVHENLTARHADGTEAKFLSKALSLNAPKMQPYVAGVIREAMG